MMELLLCFLSIVVLIVVVVIFNFWVKVICNCVVFKEVLVLMIWCCGKLDKCCVIEVKILMGLFEIMK